MATFYVQKIYDNGLPGYVQYITAIPTVSPNPATTTPVGVGPFNASTHVIQSSYDNPNQDILGGINVDTPMAPTVGQVPTWDGTEFVPATGGGGGSTVLWEWNGLDTTQFTTDNTLPAPGNTSGLTNPTLTVVASSVNPPHGMGLSVACDAGTVAGYGIWWINDLVPLQNMVIRVTMSLPDPPITLSSSEYVLAGVVFAGDLAGFGISNTLRFVDDGAGNINTARVMYQTNPVDLVNTAVLYDDLTGGGYYWYYDLYVTADRLDVDYAGGTGVPRGLCVATSGAWVPPPTTGGTYMVSSAILNSLFAAPGPAWATSSCNRVGVLLGTDSSTPTGIAFSKIQILAAE